MSERIDDLKYEKPNTLSTKEPLESDLFLTGPGEYLVQVFVAELNKDPSWKKLFGASIADYERMDFSMRELPAMRVHTPHYKRDFESWYENGEIIIDVIWPPSIRRGELQKLPATIAAAMVQQLSRPEFFQTICDQIPGLNELGKSIDVDMTLGFQWQDEIVPLTRIKANFRILLQEWYDYLNDDYRTKDDPFHRTLSDLKKIVATIEALRSDDPQDVEFTLGVDINV